MSRARRAGRQSSFQWPLTAYVRRYEDGSQLFGLADLSEPGACIDPDTPVEVRR